MATAPSASASPTASADCVAVTHAARTTLYGIQDGDTFRVVGTKEAPAAVDAPQAQQTAREQLADAPAGPVRVVSVVEAADGTPEVVVDAAATHSEASALIAKAERDPDTVAVAIDQRVTTDTPQTYPDGYPGAYPITQVNDPRRSEQNINYDGGVEGTFRNHASWRAIEYPWNLSRGSGLVVAVVDTGVDGTHEDLAGQVLPGYDFVTNATGARAGWNDDNTHGTHVAGIIAAKANNGIGIAGLAPDTHILPVKVLDASGSGFSSTVAQGIIAATDAGARVINLSLGSPTGDPALLAAVQYAQAHGVVLVAAGGNLNAPGWITLNGENYPASYPGVIGVASSNSDCGGIGGEHIDISAPGCNVLSTVPGNAYARYSGTSMATPQVTATAALLMGAGATAAQSESALYATTYRPTYIASLSCAPDPVSGVNTCTPNGVDEVKTHLLFGYGLLAPTRAMLNAKAMSGYTSGAYWNAPAQTPVVAPAAPAAPALPAAGGSPSSGASTGGGASGGGGGALQDIREVRPAAGPVSGGNTIALVGYGFSGAKKVTIGGVDAQFTVVNDAHVDVVVPAGVKPGSADIAVVLSPERGRAFAAGGYVYLSEKPVAAPAPAGPIVTTPETAPTSTAPVVPVVKAVGGKLTMTIPDGTTVVAIQARTSGKWRTVRTVKSPQAQLSLAMKPGTYRAVIKSSTGSKATAAVRLR